MWTHKGWNGSKLCRLHFCSWQSLGSFLVLKFTYFDSVPPFCGAKCQSKCLSWAKCKLPSASSLMGGPSASSSSEPSATALASAGAFVVKAPTGARRGVRARSKAQMAFRKRLGDGALLWNPRQHLREDQSFLSTTPRMDTNQAAIKLRERALLFRVHLCPRCFQVKNKDTLASKIPLAR